MTCLRRSAFLAAGVLAACGGNSGDGALPTAPPESATMVTSGGDFSEPMDAVASPDGSTFYFTANDTSKTAEDVTSAALFSVPAGGGSVTVLHSGEPLEDPSGLLVSCDGATLFVSDLSYQTGDTDLELEDEKSPIYTYDLEAGQLSALEVSGIGEAAGLAIGPDCETLYVSGYTEAGEPAVFTVPQNGGAATVLASGSPLESPSGVYVDADSVAWVMDHLPSLGLGGGLFAITSDGTSSIVIDGLDISEPAGVSLTAGGGTAVIASRDDDGNGQLITVGIESGDTTIVESAMVSPAGLRTARAAGVFAVADGDGDAIYRAE